MLSYSLTHSMKAIVTAVCYGSSLVGGTFAPTLFLGATAGAAFHKAVSSIITSSRKQNVYSYCIMYNALFVSS